MFFLENQRRIFLKTRGSMENHFFTKRDRTFAIAFETDSIERKGGIVQLVPMLLTTQ